MPYLLMRTRAVDNMFTVVYFSGDEVGAGRAGVQVILIVLTVQGFHYYLL